jgi:prophage regulatory protein
MSDVGISKVLKFKDLFHYIPLSRSSIWRRIQEGNFPKPINLGNTKSKNSAKGWLESDIAAWLEKQKSQSESLIK